MTQQHPGTFRLHCNESKCCEKVDGCFLELTLPRGEGCFPLQLITRDLKLKSIKASSFYSEHFENRIIYFLTDAIFPFTNFKLLNLPITYLLRHQEPVIKKCWCWKKKQRYFFGLCQRCDAQSILYRTQSSIHSLHK